MRKIIYLMGFMAFILFANAQTTPQHRTCATMENHNRLMQTDPDFAKNRAALEIKVQEFINNNKGNNALLSIPVVIHIVHNGDAIGSGENITDAQALSQIDVLNEDFQALNADFGNVPSTFSSIAANVDIEFCLAQQDPNGNATSGIVRHNMSQASWTQTTCNSTLKPNTIWDRNSYLNMWTVRFGGADASTLGYAQFPGGPANTDGLVMGFQYFGRVGNVSAPFNKGRTATHEIGHWLNLRHIGGDQSGGCGDDLVSDTPPQKGGSAFNGTGNGFGQNYGCPSHPLTYSGECSGTTAEMFMNYMDYTDDACMYMFTNGQKNRIQSSIGAYRISLTSSQGCVSPSNPPVADFQADAINISPGTTVNFTDLTLGAPTSWNWFFDLSGNGGASPAIANTQNPSVAFNNLGTYTIKLIASNSLGTDSITKTAYITVANCETVVFDILTDNYGSETDWDIKDASNNTVLSGTGYSDNTSYSDSACLAPGCYTFTINDSYGDGICCSFGTGSFSISNSSIDSTYYTGGQFTSQDQHQFCINAAPLGISKINDIDFSILPNPARDLVRIQMPMFDNSSIRIINSIGKLVYSNPTILSSETTINTSGLSEGIYIVEVKNKESVNYKKLIIKK